MAVMFPSSLPDPIRADPLRAAECRVYDALRDQLSAEFRVFYSSPWLGTTPDGEERDGESDFTVAHADLGLLVLEVKGGRIEVQDGTRDWFSTDRNGVRHAIKNPVAQARSGKHALLTRLKERREWRPRFIRARHAVVLPDVSSSSAVLGADSPPELFACAPEMEVLSSWVQSRMKSHDDADRSRRIEPLGPDGINALEVLLARGFTLSVDLRTHLNQDAARIETLSEQQFWIVEAAWGNQRLAVSGPAGSGKTVVAAHLAALAGAEQGLRTLLVCFNAPLAAFLQARLAGLKNVTVSTYAEFCRDICRRTGVDGPHKGQGLYDAALNALGGPGAPRLDQIIVDEGQDFEDGWLETLEFALDESGPSRLCVFFDSNQHVRGRGRHFIRGMRASRVSLTRNFRNTRRIFAFADRFYSGDPVAPMGPEGTDIEWSVAKDDNDARQILKSALGDLIVARRIEPERIAVLVADIDERDRIVTGQRLGKYTVTGASERPNGHVVVDSIRRFKGLESDVVILFQPERYIDRPEVLYVAGTRARTHLRAIGKESAIAFLRDVPVSGS